MPKPVDRYERWRLNHAAQIAARDGLAWDTTAQFFYLLVLELQGEIGTRAFKRCLDTARKQLQEDIDRAKKRKEGPNAETV